jgi:hypothetical protein
MCAYVHVCIHILHTLYVSKLYLISSGNSALHMAAGWGLMEAAEVLIESKCQVDVCTTRGQTPLHIAVQHRQPAMAQLLLQSGASPNCSDNMGHQPLHLAASLGSPELVHVLLNQGASVDHAGPPGSPGFTPLAVSPRPSRLLPHCRIEPIAIRFICSPLICTFRSAVDALG